MIYKKRILLTGSTGFIGSNLLNELKKKKYFIYLLTNNNKINIKSKKIKIINCSLTNKIKLNKALRNINITDVLHLAWYGVLSKDRNSQKQKINLKMTKNLLDSISNQKIRKIISLGSQAEYGSRKIILHENLKAKPLTEYGKIKFKNFKLMNKICKKRKISFIWLRLFTGYGPGNNQKWLIPDTINKLINKKDAKFTAGDQIYNFIYISDIISAIMKSLDCKELSGIFNVANSKSYKIKKVINLIYSKLKVKKKPSFGILKYRNNQAMIYRPSIFKIKKKLNWSPKISISKGLDKTIFAQFKALK